MPWWSWVLIWTALVLVLLGMLVWFAVWLFRKLMAAFHALTELGEQLGALESRVDDLDSERFVPAIWADRAVLAAAVESGRDDRARRRQERRDRRVARGKLLRKAPLTQRTFPHV